MIGFLDASGLALSALCCNDELIQNAYDVITNNANLINNVFSSERISSLASMSFYFYLAQ